MRRVLTLGAIVVAVAVPVYVTLPPAAQQLDPGSGDDSIPGIIHVHTNRSDGSRSPDAVAAAAARAGLKFVVFTDHDDATRKPEPPTYRSGVLCLDGVEISTTGGHYLAMDMGAAPYPLGGEARDVVDDVRRLGGFGIAAHPDSPKPELRWREWTAPFDAMELQNLDTSWRVVAGQPGWRPKWRLFTALLDYPFRGPEVIASLLEAPPALHNWEALTRRRRVVVVAGADAHARLALRSEDPGESRFALPFPSYETAFRVMSTRVRIGAPLKGDAAADAAIVFQAIRAGRIYLALDAVATPPVFEFAASNASGTSTDGGELTVNGPLLLRIHSNAPADFTTIVRNGTDVIASNRGVQDLTVHAPASPGVFWVEIVSERLGRSVTWIRSNPVYVRATGAAGTLPVRAASTVSMPIFDGRAAGAWAVEHDVSSLAAVDLASRTDGRKELRLRFGLSGGPPSGQFAGLVVDLPDTAAPYDRIRFAARAEKPMRLSVQARGAQMDRWQRSVVVDATEREYTLFFDDLTPVRGTETFKPTPADIRSVLFVIDTTNTKPGSSGRLWVARAALEK